MKGEYNNNNNIEDPNQTHPHNNNNQNNPLFFTKYTPHDQNQISDPIPISCKKPKTTTTNEEGAIVEVTRRPRGRPPGSKNKPKPPIIINNELKPAMSTYILEVQSGSEIIGSLTRYTRRRGMSICVLNANGSVSNVTLKQPLITSGSNNNAGGGGGTVLFRGEFDILSFSAVLLLGCSNNHNDKGFGFGFSVTLGGPQGQIFGGKVVEPLIAGTTVYVIATSFNCHNYQRLPGNEDEERVVENVSVGGGSGGADVMWGPTSKAPLSSPY